MKTIIATLRLMEKKLEMQKGKWLRPARGIDRLNEEIKDYKLS